jgi:riboflavin kinase/FMN adenylyltransferase
VVGENVQPPRQFKFQLFGTTFLKIVQTSHLNLPEMPPCVLTLGTFDGLHLAHRELIRRVREKAALEGLATLLLSFEPHPRDFLRPGQGPGRLSTPEEKRQLLEAQDVDRVLLLDFNHALSELEARAFIRDVLFKLNMKHLVIGHNHAFGHNRSGNRQTLSALADECSFTMEVVEPVFAAGEAISSTRIRRALAEGELALAEALLGRPYSMRGMIVKGHGRGRGIGFPTANLQVLGAGKLLPAAGVYAARARIRGTWHEGMLNLGPRPTFGEAEIVPEMHFFSDMGSLYGEELELEFLAFIRHTIRFNGVQELSKQLVLDRQRIQDWLASKG